MMKVKEFKLVKMSSYSPEEGYREWYEYQPQYNNNIVYVNLGEMDKNAGRTDNT